MISGRGSNMMSLIQACMEEGFPAKIVAVISDNPQAKGLETAAAYEVPTFAVPRQNYNDRAAFESALLDKLGEIDFDCICLAGFMRVLSPYFLSKLNTKTIVNMHPSLLPRHKGLHVHEKVLAAGDKKSGCSVHYVTEDLDSGEIIVQKEVDVMPDDTPESLAARVLNKEHEAYPEALRIIAEKSHKQ